MKKLKKISTISVFFSGVWRFVLLVLLLLGAYLLIKSLFFSASASLSPIKTVPAFSVSYVVSGNSLWGLGAMSDIKDNMKIIKEAGFGGIKVGFNLNQSHSDQGAVINEAAKNGLYSIGLFSGHNVKPADRAFSEDEMNNWQEMVRSNVRKYKNTVYFWEIWNEPNMTALRFRYGTPQEYLELLKTTSAIIRQENPNAQIIMNTDMGDRESSTFTEALMALNPEPYYDILSLHPYGSNDAEIDETIFKKHLSDQKSMMQRFSIDKPLMISEIGQPSGNIGETEQMSRAEMAFRTANHQNIPIVWLHFSDKLTASIDGKSGWGLMRLDGSAKPVFDALKSYIKSVSNR